MALSTHVRRLPQWLRQSSTWDRGMELAHHKTFTLATDTLVSVCDPQGPWPRGTNENTNRRLRQYFPNGTDRRSSQRLRLCFGQAGRSFENPMCVTAEDVASFCRPPRDCIRQDRRRLLRNIGGHSTGARRVCRCPLLQPQSQLHRMRSPRLHFWQRSRHARPGRPHSPVLATAVPPETLEVSRCSFIPIRLAAHSDWSEAISIEKRYFTSDLSSLS